MDTGSFAEYLAGLGQDALAQLISRRPDVRIEPVPQGFAQLGQRLCGPDSLGAALRAVNRDALTVGRAVAVLGSSADLPEIARLLDAPERDVQSLVDDLCGRGLAWTDSGTVRIPRRLADHWTGEIGGGRPVAAIARSVLANDLRATAEAWDIDVTGLRKAELVTRLAETFRDVRAVAAVISKLPPTVRNRLEQVRYGFRGHVFSYVDGYSRRGVDPDRPLADAGLVLRVNHQWEMPREVGVAAWLAERNVLLTGRPDIPAVDVDSAALQGTAQAAARDMVGAVTTLLDEARSTPITALKKGGIGPRERSRLSARLSLPADLLVLCIDLTYAAGLLGKTDGGYVPTDAYVQWREAEPNRQWAALVTAWLGLDHAPTSREIQGDKELPPPLPLASAAGIMRCALLRAARGGWSVRKAGDHIDWFFPLHGYEGEQRDDKVTAAIREAEQLGVVAADVLTEFGEHLLDVADAENQTAELADRVRALLPETPCTVILQSDLTAVVSGLPSATAARLLGAAAVSEARGTAGVWRFTPASVRAALDAGWTAKDLLAELAALSDHPLPQPLEYLINDVARRHGQIRVRGMRSCVVADEAMVTEILHTKALAKLHFAQVAPTVLSCPFELDDVLTKLRAVGLSPVAEDAVGSVIVERRPEHRVSTVETAFGMRQPRRVTADDLAKRLMAEPSAEIDAADGSGTLGQLAELNPFLDEAELMLLSYAVDHQQDVTIAYRDRSGTHTVRSIQPHQVYGRWLDAWCHLRDAQRDFTVANIESVSPAG
jgi:hypothetical protein